MEKFYKEEESPYKPDLNFIGISAHVFAHINIYHLLQRVVIDKRPSPHGKWPLSM